MMDGPVLLTEIKEEEIVKEEPAEYFFSSDVSDIVKEENEYFFSSDVPNEIQNSVQLPVYGDVAIKEENNSEDELEQPFAVNVQEEFDIDAPEETASINVTEKSSHEQTVHTREGSSDAASSETQLSILFKKDNLPLGTPLARAATTQDTSCHFCKVSFATVFYLQAHVKKCMRNPWRDAKNSRKSNSLMYCCGLCPKMFPSLLYLERHRMSHNGIEAKCKYCGKKFASLEGLNYHRRTCPSVEGRRAVIKLKVMRIEH